MSSHVQDIDAHTGNSVVDEAVPSCYHCGDRMPADSTFVVTIDGRHRRMCCAGCEAVAQTIVDGGLADYYRLRTTTAQTARDRVPAILERAATYDQQATASLYCRELGEHDREASLILEDIECAACAWLVERTLIRQPGVAEAAVNFSTHRARIRWDDRETSLGAVMAAVARIGYQTQPYDPARRESALRTEGRTRLRRLGIAGLFGMQVMMVAVVLYSGDWWGIDPAFFTLFRWLSAGLCVPILVYSAWPFFSAAARGLRHGMPGMDVPVSLGLLIAFVASVYATVVGEGHVYFDSVAMFTFFLLLARYFEYLARKRAQQVTEALVSPAPEFAHRLGVTADDTETSRDETNATAQDAGQQTTTLVAVAELTPGDFVRVLPGESIPADGVISAGSASVDESLLSGESRPLPKKAGDNVYAGSINRGSALELEVMHIGADMVISRVLSLVERASESRPRLTQLAERVARIFVVGVVVVAAAVAGYWWSVDGANWLSATIAVLVVTCPCALSLATPAAMTAAAGAMTQCGLVPARGLAIESLANIDHVVFDKTATLTTGNYKVRHTHASDASNATTLLRVAAALERHSEHPIARAFDHLSTDSNLTVKNVCTHAGSGISGTIDRQRWYLGTAAWVSAQADIECPDLTGLGINNDVEDCAVSVVMIANDQKESGLFELGDELRPGAAQLIDALRSKGIAVSICSGDSAAAVRDVAQRLQIDDYFAGQRPQDKLNRLTALNAMGKTTVMIGDGINDAPVLAGATVSIAMGGGAQAARASADFILINEQLPAIAESINIAQKGRRVMRQNMAWALIYNLLALPFAAAGWIAPWMAALGMSFSALVVVGNSLRLSAPRVDKPRPFEPVATRLATPSTTRSMRPQ